MRSAFLGHSHPHHEPACLSNASIKTLTWRILTTCALVLQSTEYCAMVLSHPSNILKVMRRLYRWESGWYRDQEEIISDPSVVKA